jgi:Domain of unknown function (DUF4440)
MTLRTTCAVLALAVLLAVVGPASAQTWSPEQQEIWKVEQKQWQMSQDGDSTWIDTMVHPNMRYWDVGQPMPQDTASLARWNRYTTANGKTLEHEIFPIAATITGNLAVVQYHYQVARENYKKEREMATGHYTDVLLKDNGVWKFIAWAGGDDPKK